MRALSRGSAVTEVEHPVRDRRILAVVATCVRVSCCSVVRA